jgi:hypothetical protein
VYEQIVHALIENVLTQFVLLLFVFKNIELITSSAAAPKTKTDTGVEGPTVTIYSFIMHGFNFTMMFTS